MNRKTMLSLIVCRVIVSMLLATSGLAAGKPKSMVGKMAPALLLTDTTGKAVELQTYLRAGNVILLNFWGLRCSACLQEMPFLKRMQITYRDPGLVVLGVNVDGVDWSTLRDLFRNTGVEVNYPLLGDPELKTADDYNMIAAPYSLIIARDGQVVSQHEGYVPEDEKRIEEEIVSALRK